MKNHWSGLIQEFIDKNSAEFQKRREYLRHSMYINYYLIAYHNNGVSSNEIWIYMQNHWSGTVKIVRYELPRIRQSYSGYYICRVAVEDGSRRFEYLTNQGWFVEKPPKIFVTTTSAQKALAKVLALL